MSASENMIDWLYDLQHFGIKLGLDNIRGLLTELEHPERNFRNVLVAGTNGKGSVSSMLETMLRASGKRTGLFTSPHLLRPHERIRVDGEEIPNGDLQRLLRTLRVDVDKALANGNLDAHPSFFEAIAATALRYFAERGVEVAVLEVGLGGRLDATNAIDADLSVIVGIDLDHTKTLGPTIRHIAAEKAGIVKPGKSLICGAVRQGAIDVIRGVCHERRANYVDARERIALTADDGAHVSYRSQTCAYNNVALSLPGRHQIDNARVALAAFEEIAPTLDIKVDAEVVQHALGSTTWRGRLEWIAATGDTPELLFDAAHNPAGIQALATYLATLDRRPSVVIFGTTTGKPMDQMLDPLARFADQVVVTRPSVRRGVDVEEVEPFARRAFPRTRCITHPAEAIRTAFADVPTGGFALITGSLYLVGEIYMTLQDQAAPGPVSF